MSDWKPRGNEALSQELKFASARVATWRFETLWKAIMQLAPLRILFESHLRPGMLGTAKDDAALRFGNGIPRGTHVW